MVKQSKYKEIIVSDGTKTKKFDTPKEVAEFFDVSIVTIYNVLKSDRKLRGCTIKGVQNVVQL